VSKEQRKVLGSFLWLVMTFGWLCWHERHSFSLMFIVPGFLFFTLCLWQFLSVTRSRRMRAALSKG
jgi:hypothetical protein